MPQILGYLTVSEKQAFHNYAAILGIDASALGNLLIQRELKLRRLPVLAEAGAKPGAVRSAKIIAHQPSDETKCAFDRHAELHGLKPSQAAALVFRTELRERWLQKSLCRVDSV